MIAFEPRAVHLWIAHDEEIVDAGLIERYERLLAPAEAERRQRFRQPRHRHQYLVTRALLRHVLGLYLDADPATLKFATNRWGKPHLAGPARIAPAFNVSHCDGRVVLAMAAGGEIGVDVEARARAVDALGIADHYFAASEVAQLHATPAHRQVGRFLDFWTLKEAYIKACGEGLSIPLQHFAYHFEGDRRVRITFAPERDDAPGRWRFWQMQPDGDHRIAVAHRSADAPHDGPLVVREIVPLEGHRTIHLPAITCVREPEPA